MRKEEIEKFVQQQEEYRRKQEWAFQDSGESKYRSQVNRAEKLLDIAYIALNAADDHEKMLHYRMILNIYGRKAQEAVDSCDMDKLRLACAEFAKCCEDENLISKR